MMVSVGGLDVTGGLYGALGGIGSTCLVSTVRGSDFELLNYRERLGPVGCCRCRTYCQQWIPVTCSVSSLGT